MIVNVYSLYDKKTMVYGMPFYAHNDGHAIRCVGDDIAAGNSLVASHPEDFQLTWIGKFDDGLGS